MKLRDRKKFALHSFILGEFTDIDIDGWMKLNRMRIFDTETNLVIENNANLVNIDGSHF